MSVFRNPPRKMVACSFCDRSMFVMELTRGFVSTYGYVNFLSNNISALLCIICKVRSLEKNMKILVRKVSKKKRHGS